MEPKVNAKVNTGKDGKVMQAYSAELISDQRVKFTLDWERFADAESVTYRLHPTAPKWESMELLVTLPTGGCDGINRHWSMTLSNIPDAILSVGGREQPRLKPYKFEPRKTGVDVLYRMHEAPGETLILTLG